MRGYCRYKPSLVVNNLREKITHFFGEYARLLCMTDYASRRTIVNPFGILCKQQIYSCIFYSSLERTNKNQSNAFCISYSFLEHIYELLPFCTCAQFLCNHYSKMEEKQ